MQTKTSVFALLAVGLLAVGAVAIPVAAHGEADSETSSKGPRERALEQQHKAQERRDNASRNATIAHERYQDRCVERAESLNESDQDRCMRFSQFADRAHKARREAHALIGAIEAIERRIGRLEAREIALEQKLASGNFSGNETNSSIEMRIEKIEEHQEKLAERLAHLRERLEALHAKWAEVRDHVQARRHGAEHGDDEEDASSSSSESVSSTTTSTAA